jgi:hypothetical protein
MRIRLKETCEFAGRIYQRGEELILPDGMKGPMRAQRKLQDRIDYSTNPPIDANRQLGELEDVPLYDVVEGAKSLDHTPEQKAEADAQSERKPAKEEPAEPKPQPEPQPRPAELPGIVRDLTHIEERDRR